MSYNHITFLHVHVYMLSRNPVFRNPVIPTKNRNFRFSLTFNNKNIVLTSNYNVNLIFVLYYKFLIQISCDNHIIFYVVPTDPKYRILCTVIRTKKT